MSRPFLALVVLCLACGSSSNPDAAVPLDQATAVDLAMLDSELADAAPSDLSVDDAALPDAASVDSRAFFVGDGGAFADTVRVVAANLSTGNNQDYNGGEGIRILRGVHADVVLLQEFRYLSNSTTDLRAFVDSAVGTEFNYVRGASTEQIPNGVLSRFPVLSSGEWTDPQVSNRAFLWAQLDVPGPRDLWVVSLHLLTSNAGARDAEAHALLPLLQQNVPAGDFLIVGGDLNTSVRAEPCIATLSALVVSNTPWPSDNFGNGNTNGPRTRPHDWLLASANLIPLEVPVVIGASGYTSGLVVDTRVYSPIAEIAPALTGDSGANGMQHMAVLRDFVIAANGSTTDMASVVDLASADLQFHD